jgi:hypothetical protein
MRVALRLTTTFAFAFRLLLATLRSSSSTLPERLLVRRTGLLLLTTLV